MPTDDDDDFLELPVVVARPTGLARREATGLTEGQKDKLIDGGVMVAAGAVEVVKVAMEIWRIRQTSDAKVGEIQAETDRLRTELQGELEKMREARARVRDGGSLFVDLLRAAPAVLAMLPEGDRATYLEQFPGFLESLLHGPT